MAAGGAAAAAVVRTAVGGAPPKKKRRGRPAGVQHGPMPESQRHAISQGQRRRAGKYSEEHRRWGICGLGLEPTTLWSGAYEAICDPSWGRPAFLHAATATRTGVMTARGGLVLPAAFSLLNLLPASPGSTLLVLAAALLCAQACSPAMHWACPFWPAGTLRWL